MSNLSPKTGAPKKKPNQNNRKSKVEILRAKFESTNLESIDSVDVEDAINYITSPTLSPTPLSSEDFDHHGHWVYNL